MYFRQSMLAASWLALAAASVSASEIAVNLQADALVYSPLNDTLYAAVGDSASVDANTLVPINPHTGQLGTPIAIGNNPAQLVISDNGQYIYAVVDRGISNGTSVDTDVQRYNVPTGQLDLKFSAASGGSQFIERINSIPGQPQSVIVATQPRVGNNLGPTFIDNNGTVLPNTIGNSSAAPQEVGVNETGTIAYGYNRAGNVSWTMQINSNGLTNLNQPLPTLLSPTGTEDIQVGHGNIYDSKGHVYSIATGTSIGTFAAANPSNHANTFILDIPNSRLYSLTQSGSATQLLDYNMDTMQLLNGPFLSGVSGTVGNLTRFGNDGLAFTTPNQVILYENSFILPEPSTYILFAFGAATLFGVALHRHRQRVKSAIAPIIAVLVVAAVCLSRNASAAEPAQPSKPNIIIVMPDDVGYGDFACHGNPIIKTPAIDALWSRSVRFTDFHVSPTCAPTRAALMTGRHEFKNGVTHTIDERERLTPHATTLAQVLKSAGYTTGIFGKWHLGDEPDRWPDKRGFDEMFIHGAGGIGQTYAGSCGDAPDNSYFNPAILHNGRFEKTHGYCTDVFFGQAEKWIDSVKDRGPFFAYITPNAAHAPLDVPDEYFAHHRGQVADPAAKFYGMIENIDDNLGRLLARLKAWSLEDNTLVIFLTDNGGTAGTAIFNAGMRGAKNTAYQGGTRVASFWRWPVAWRGGVDCAALTAHIDILPTLAEIVGAKLDDSLAGQVEGRSLLPLLKQPDGPWPDRFLVTHCGRWPRGEIATFKFKHCSIRNQRVHAR